MKLLKEHRLKVLCLLWVLLIANMAAIWLLSAKTAEESTVQSDKIVAAPKAVIEAVKPERADDKDLYIVLQFAVRKTAHVLEFAALAVWAVGLALMYGLKLPYLLGAAFSALWGAADELHQYFVPGREAKGTDFLFDTLGAALAAAVMWLVIRALRRRAPEH